jgi:hypothetical protein
MFQFQFEGGSGLGLTLLRNSSIPFSISPTTVSLKKTIRHFSEIIRHLLTGLCESAQLLMLVQFPPCLQNGVPDLHGHPIAYQTVETFLLRARYYPWLRLFANGYPS